LLNFETAEASGAVAEPDALATADPAAFGGALKKDVMLLKLELERMYDQEVRSGT
jgi:hypothetical protein